MNIGDVAPNFELKDQNGKVNKLSDYVGKWVLLYFYPKDDTPGCTKEACTIRDNFSLFIDAGIVVLGVSVDSVDSHGKFTEKYKLPFTILADEQKEVVKKYGVWHKNKVLGHEYEEAKRVSFVINPDSKIAKIYEDVKPAEHAKEVLADIEKLK